MASKVTRMVARKCRACINKQFRLDLEQRAFHYYPYQAACISCGQLRNIIMDVRLGFRQHFWFKKTRAFKGENPLKRNA